MQSNIFNSGKLWPYAISISTIMIIVASIYTVIVALSRPVSQSDLFMQDYHEANRNINDIIMAQAAFDNLYTIEHIENKLNTNNSLIQYKIVTKEKKVVNNAKIELIITRPNIHDYDSRFENPKIAEGIYSFDNIKLAKEGRWNLMAKISIEDNYRYYNLKADTRYLQTTEY